MLLPALGRDLSLGSDEPLGDLPDLDGLVDVLSLCLGGERRGEVLHLTCWRMPAHSSCG